MLLVYCARLYIICLCTMLRQSGWTWLRHCANVPIAIAQVLQHSILALLILQYA